LVAATNNFNVHNKLGEGGFGPVYKVNIVKFNEPVFTLMKFLCKITLIEDRY
jgi:hypothetical protein